MLLTLINFQSEIHKVPPDDQTFSRLSIKEDSPDPKKSINPPAPRNHELLTIDGSRDVSTTEILREIKESPCLREISLSYSQLNDELLMALSVDKHMSLETMRIQAAPDTPQVPVINKKTWQILENNYPNLNLILSLYMDDDDEENCSSVLTPEIPVTHLHLGGYTTASVLEKVSENCPRLFELVVSSHGPGIIDPHLIKIAKKCSRLAAVGLADCELTCSGLVEFVNICREKLEFLSVWETSLVEDQSFDVTSAVAKVSSLLNRNWQPEFVPPW